MVRRHKKYSKEYSKHVFGAFLLIFFVGIQSPQLPFKAIVMILGIVLIVPAIFQMFGQCIKMSNKYFVGLAVVAIVVILIIAFRPGNDTLSSVSNIEEKDTIVKEPDSGEIVGVAEPLLHLSEREIETLKDGTKYLVHPDKISSGGPPKDGIPSIDNPKFVSVKEADEWIRDDELVLALEYKGAKRVYPLQILVWHEIVNDNVAGDPILVTYCPLCGSGIAYERSIDGQNVEFGTSGKLYNSNLVMYDRKTDTYWTQIDGIAIIGELTGQQLTSVSIDTVVWRDWKEVHPDSIVLSQETGYVRQYGTDPYGSYYENSFVFFRTEAEDDNVHPKTVIFGIELDGHFKAYKEDDLMELDTIEDEINGVNIRVERDEVGIVTVTNVDTGSEIVKERDFWFAWYAFHPDTILYEK